MSARKPALPQGLPAATTGGRLATVLSAGLGRLDVNNNDIKRKQTPANGHQPQHKRARIPTPQRIRLLQKDDFQ